MSKNKKKYNKEEQAKQDINEQEVNKAEENTSNDMNKNENSEATAEKEVSLEEKIKQLEAEKKELNDKFLRLYSEFDNYRKRTIKEKQEISKSASISVIKDVLSIVDDFERAIENNHKSDDIDAIKEGFTLIHNRLASFLKSKGVEEITAKGEHFDVDKHEAVTQVPVQSDEEKGKVIDVIEKGYKINDDIVRFPKVVVGK